MININNSKERLLKESRALLAERSIDDVGVREIARASVVNVSAIFYHFDGKIGLIMTIVEQFISEKMMPVIFAFGSNTNSDMSAPVVLSKLLDKNKETL